MIRTSKSQDSQKVYKHKFCQIFTTLLFTKYSETQLPAGIKTKIVVYTQNFVSTPK